jgi:hypothetical protein
MYKIHQKDFFSNYVVNGQHVLSLRLINSKHSINFKGYNIYMTDGYYYIDIKVEDYLKLVESNKKLLYGYKRKILDNHHYNNDFNFDQIRVNNTNDLNNTHNKFDILIDENLYKNTRLLKIHKRMKILDNLIQPYPEFQGFSTLVHPRVGDNNVLSEVVLLH